MIAAAIIVIVIVMLVGTAAVAGALRRLVRDEYAIESRLRAPDTHTISYAVPNGVDPGDLRAALARGGFTGIVTTTGARECLVVECGETDRARLRRVIESAHEPAYDGSELELRPVVFEDER
jgi:hypothetical protein